MTAKDLCGDIEHPVSMTTTSLSTACFKNSVLINKAVNHASIPAPTTTIFLIFIVMGSISELFSGSYVKMLYAMGHLQLLH